jgi:tetratricopeptide (TPR) repeat protein
MRGILIIGILFIQCFYSIGQTYKKQVVENVYQRLVNAYGNPKAAPKLIYLDKDLGGPASFSQSDKSITIDKRLYDICRKLGKDSLNAFSIVLSHELAHYYYEHSFCSDFGYLLNSKNKAFSTKIISLGIKQKLIYESQADKKGLFYSAIAGFQPFEINNQLLDLIYISYQHKDVSGYPTKAERKEIGLTSSIEIKSLFNKFVLGLNHLNEGKLQSSIIEFETITKEFPSREIYNNLGIARARMALLLKPKTKEETEHPERFKYPLEIENKTRLNREDTRSIQLDNNYIELLGEAQSNFEKAISLDPSFVKSYINLACIYDLLDNPDNAIGTIKRLSKVDQNTTDSKIILAIAYFHSDRESLAEKIWKELNL